MDLFIRIPSETHTGFCYTKRPPPLDYLVPKRVVLPGPPGFVGSRLQSPEEPARIEAPQADLIVLLYTLSNIYLGLRKSKSEDKTKPIPNKYK